MSVTTVETTIEFEKWMSFDFNKPMSVSKHKRLLDAAENFSKGNFPEKVKKIIAQIGGHYVSECSDFKKDLDEIKYHVRQHRNSFNISLGGYRSLNFDAFCKYIAHTRRIDFNKK